MLAEQGQRLAEIEQVQIDDVSHATLRDAAEEQAAVAAPESAQISF